jgi:hypothetical protein
MSGSAEARGSTQRGGIWLRDSLPVRPGGRLFLFPFGAYRLLSGVNNSLAILVPNTAPQRVSARYKEFRPLRR